ncbi:MAG: NFACT RNA binding domain-containing protein [Thermacetogeniaceae bacterium]
MSPDGITIHLIVEELNSELQQSRVDRVYQPEQLEIILSLRKPGQSLRLLLSAHAENARLHLTSQEKTNPPSPPTFCFVLRKYLEGSRLLDIRQVDLDRVVYFTFSRLSESGGYQEVHLISEIMGKHSNLILVDPQTGQIIDAVKRYSHAVSRYREVLPGRIYIPPPLQSKVSPLDLDEERFVQVLQDGNWELKLKDLVFKHLAGIGPDLARELMFRANLPADLLMEDCGEYELRSLWQALQKTISPLLRGECEPTLVFDGKKPLGYTPYLPTMYQPLSLTAAPSLNAAADTFYTSRTEMARFEQLQNSLAGIVRREATRVDKKLWLQQQAQSEAVKSQDYRIKGEMLLAHLHLLERGQTMAHLPNLYEPEAPPLEIALDPSLTPSQNAQRLFRRYERSRNTLKTNQLRMAQTLEEQAYLASVRTALDLAETSEELQEIRVELEEAGFVKVKAKERKGKPQKKTPLQVSKIPAAENFEILIGKNNRQNDYLTMHLAKKEDLWLHAREIPGAHVIIRSQPGREIPASALEQAARLAAYYSEARTSSKVPVDYTARKNVWKPAKARPGFVLYENYQTILVNPEAPE